MSALPVNDLFGLSLNFILHHLRLHQEKWALKNEIPPLFVGFNGVQGAGKSFLVRLHGVIFNSWDSSCFTILKQLDVVGNYLKLTILSQEYNVPDGLMNLK